MLDKDRLTYAIMDLEEKMAISIVEKMIREKVEISEVIEACRDGMAEVGDRFEKGEYFLSELIMSGELLKKIMVYLKKEMGDSHGKFLGTVVIGTVEGDLHNIGKDIVVNVLEANGYKVIDLGVDVSSDKYVAAINNHKPQIVGLSGLITEAIGPMKKTVDAIIAAGLRDKVHIIIGGGVVNEDVKEFVGADKWSNNVSTGLKEIKEWVGGNDA